MESHLLADIGKAIIAASALSLPAHFLGIPLILAYLIAGAVLGPHLGFGFIQDSASITNISEIGLVLLMFILGLEINLKKLIQLGKPVLLSSAVQISGSIFLGYGVFWALGMGLSNLEMIYLAVACSLSSTLIVIKILSDKMDLDSVPSKITLGILVIQDFIAIGFLALQPNLSHLQYSSLFISLGKVGILVLISWLLARFVLPRLFKKAGEQPELMLILAMAWCFGICGVADYLNLSLEMGALVAGVSIASFPYHLDVAAKISSLRDFFITLFFVSLGLQIPMPTGNVLQIASVMVVLALVTRFLTIFPTLHKLGYANRASLIPAVNLSQLSEFSLVLATLGVSYRHISSDILSAFIIAAVVTALISAFLIPAAHDIYKAVNTTLEKIGFKDVVVVQGLDLENQETIHPTVIVLGFHRQASSLLYEIQTKYSGMYLKQVLVVDFNPEAHRELKKQNIKCVYGDISHVDTLRSLRLSTAKMIICSIPDKILKGTTNLKMLQQLKNLAPQAELIMTAENIENARQLYDAGAGYVFIPRIVSSANLLEVLERIQMEGTEAIRRREIKMLTDRNEIIS